VNIVSYQPEYAKALEEALAEVGNRPFKLVKVRTKRVRVIEMPERVMTKNHNRDYGKERLQPRTKEWRTRRTFVFSKDIP
jgi:hypothetical protein